MYDLCRCLPHKHKLQGLIPLIVLLNQAGKQTNDQMRSVYQL